MLLTIDIGNTQTVLGLFQGDDLDHTWRIATYDTRTADELAVLITSLLTQHDGGTTVTGIALCSTVPVALHEMRQMCTRYYSDIPVVVVEPGVRTGVPILTDNPKEVGSDRIVNSLAAATLLRRSGHRRRLRHGHHVRRGLGQGRVPRWSHRPRSRDLGGGAGRPWGAAPQGRAGASAIGRSAATPSRRCSPASSSASPDRSMASCAGWPSSWRTIRAPSR